MALCTQRRGVHEVCLYGAILAGDLCGGDNNLFRCLPWLLWTSLDIAKSSVGMTSLLEPLHGFPHLRPGPRPGHTYQTGVVAWISNFLTPYGFVTLPANLRSLERVKA